MNDLETANMEAARGMLERKQFAEAVAVLRRHAAEYPDSQYSAMRSRYLEMALEAMAQAETVKREGTSR